MFLSLHLRFASNSLVEFYPYGANVHYIIGHSMDESNTLQNTIQWMNEYIAKDKIKSTMECSQDEIVFLDTNIVVTPIADKKVVITTDKYSKKTDPH